MGGVVNITNLARRDWMLRKTGEFKNDLQALSQQADASKVMAILVARPTRKEVIPF
jgi:hypothetical protein